MGCLQWCFGSTKKRHINSELPYVPHPNPSYRKQYSPVKVAVDEIVASKQDLLEEEEESIKPTILETWRGKQEEEEELRLGAQKKVTFDSNVKEYKHVHCDEILEESDQKGGDFTKPANSSECASSFSSLGSFPLNHRYQNCRESDDELCCEVSDLDEDEDENEEAYDEYSDNEYYSRQLPGISTRSSCKNSERDEEPFHKETITQPGFHRGARDRAGYVHSVLNLVDNTAPWKILKAKPTPQLKPQKEIFQMDLGEKHYSSKLKCIPDGPENTYGVAVDASLSTWLGSSKKILPTKGIPFGLEHMSSPASMSSHGSNSVRSHEERPVLGALNMEKLEQFSASSSLRRSPSGSPNVKPLVGTVGIYGSDENDRTPAEGSSPASSFKGIPNTTSKYREDQKVKWHSTPFETRLEQALNPMCN